MNLYAERAPFIALVDDDQHSAQLLTRMLLAHGAPAIQWYGGASDGQTMLTAVLGDVSGRRPSLVIVDLKAHSASNLEFLRATQSLLRQTSIPVAVMVQSGESNHRDTLLAAGATAVFLRHAELDAYRREAAGLVSFWARSQRLEAVGM